MIYTNENTQRGATVYFVPKQGTKYKLDKALSICTETNQVEIIENPVSYDKATGAFNIKTLYCSNILVIHAGNVLPELFIAFE